MSTEENDSHYPDLESNTSANVDVRTMNEKQKNAANDHLLPTYKESTKDEYKSVQLSYHKLKLSFTCMLILNALLLIVVIVCMILIVPGLSEMKITGKDSPETKDLIKSAEMKCMSIKEKLHKLYRNGQMVENVKDSDKCSLEDLIDSFIQHVEDSMHKDKSKNSSAFHLVANNTDTARCQDSRTLYCLNNWKLSMNTTQIQVKNESIVVPSSGPYFLYSRVIINAKIKSSLQDKDMVTHYIRYSNTGHYFSDLESSSIKCGVIKNTMSHISYIEKIQYLEKGSEIKVALDLPRDVSMQPSISGGAFGMFRLE